MESNTISQIKHAANTEVVRRLLIKYFVDKNFNQPGSFDRQLFPSLIQDLPQVIPVLSSKIEVVPHVEEIDPMLGKAKIGWNLFALGSHRMYLGETCHNNLSDLARQIHGGMIMPGAASSRQQTTPRRVVHFITRVLGTNDDGYVDLSPPSRQRRNPGDVYITRGAMLGIPQSFHGRAGM